MIIEREKIGQTEVILKDIGLYKVYTIRNGCEISSRKRWIHGGREAYYQAIKIFEKMVELAKGDEQEKKYAEEVGTDIGTDL